MTERQGGRPPGASLTAIGTKLDELAMAARLRLALDVLELLAGMDAVVLRAEGGDRYALGDVVIAPDGRGWIAADAAKRGAPELIWELIAGRALVDAPAPLHDVVDDVPTDVSELVEQLLGDADGRRAEEVAEAFERAAEGHLASRDDIRELVPASAPSVSRSPTPPPVSRRPTPPKTAAVAPPAKVPPPTPSPVPAAVKAPSPPPAAVKTTAPVTPVAAPEPAPPPSSRPPPSRSRAPTLPGPAAARPPSRPPPPAPAPPAEPAARVPSTPPSDEPRVPSKPPPPRAPQPTPQPTSARGRSEGPAARIAAPKPADAPSLKLVPPKAGESAPVRSAPPAPAPAPPPPEPEPPPPPAAPAPDDDEGRDLTLPMHVRPPMPPDEPEAAATTAQAEAERTTTELPDAETAELVPIEPAAPADRPASERADYVAPRPLAPRKITAKGTAIMTRPQLPPEAKVVVGLAAPAAPKFGSPPTAEDAPPPPEQRRSSPGREGADLPTSPGMRRPKLPPRRSPVALIAAVVVVVFGLIALAIALAS
jgi:hypothetical protein